MSSKCIKMLIQKVALLLAVVIASAFAGPIQDEHKELRAEHVRRLSKNRIVGGETAEPGEFPYQVSLRDVDYGHFCGGAIVSNRWILTAQQCTVFYITYTYYLEVVIRAHAIESSGWEYPVAQIIHHEGFTYTNYTNDISLVQTVWTIYFDELSAPIPFSNYFIDAGVESVASGWGLVNLTSYDDPNYLQFLELVTLTNIDCKARYVELSELVTDSNLCAYSSEVGRGLCYGDAGNPLVANGELIGLASFGEPCALGRPDTFTRVSFFYDWIVSTIEYSNATQNAIL